MNLEDSIFDCIRYNDHQRLLRCLAQRSIITLNQGHILRAAVGSTPQIIKILLDRGFDINTIDRNGQTPLMYSLVNINQDVTNYLISRGAKISIGLAHISSGYRSNLKKLMLQFFSVNIGIFSYKNIKQRKILRSNIEKFLDTCKLSLACKMCIINNFSISDIDC